MENVVVTFLKSKATCTNRETFSAIFGDINLGETKAIKQSSGTVYGIIAESETPLIDGMKSLEGYPNLYPIYWGKDIAPVSRIKAHVQNHESTGNVDLRNINEIKNKRLLFGAILVADYQNFESYLHENFPPLRGSDRPGRQSQIIEIIN